MLVLKTFLSTLCLVAITACLPGKKGLEKAGSESLETHTFDWTGTYFGILPCLDCPGMEVELSLHKDTTFTIVKNRKGEQNHTDQLQGDVYWNTEKQRIRLGILIPNFAPEEYLLTGNKLLPLDAEGKKMNWERGKAVMLVKTGNPDVEDKRWQIREIFGNEVKGGPESDFIVFHSKEKKIIAKAHCNMLQFGYSIRFENQIQVKPGPSTKMGCPDETESELIRALQVADHFTLEGTTLTMSQGSTVLATFLLAP